MKEVLRDLDLGNGVAEFDDALEQYFVENEAFFQLVSGKVDIVAGDKGTGKTALYRILQKRYRSIKELNGVEILAGFNPAGNPIFQRLVQEKQLTEGQYVSVWKTYVLSLVGNWLLEIVGNEFRPPFSDLQTLLEETGLRSADEKPDTIFGRIVNFFFKKPASAEVTLTMSETGIPIIIPKLNFAGDDGEESQPKEVRHEQALGLLNACLGELGYSVWIALDRLDEAFQGFPDIEVPALRALLRTYLDLLEFGNLRLKLFLRRDLFRRIIGDGFVNLTHINARKIEIVWGEDDLRNLLCRRVRDNTKVVERLNAKDLSDNELFYRIFPPKVDQAEKKPTSWNWLMARTRDGNDVKPPRNLIEFTTLARDEQIKAEGRAPRPFDPSQALILADSMKSALRVLSERRVTDTLLAEAGPEIQALVKRFRRSKAEHNLESLGKLLLIEGDKLDAAVRLLTEVGFLEELKTSWKVPMLYRDGLEVTQGKAFDGVTASDDDD